MGRRLRAKSEATGNLELGEAADQAGGPPGLCGYAGPGCFTNDAEEYSLEGMSGSSEQDDTDEVW